jgi:hypothetical protein
VLLPIDIAATPDVRYLIVGGLAVVAYGYVRFTQEIDLVI